MMLAPSRGIISLCFAGLSVASTAGTLQWEGVQQALNVFIQPAHFGSKLRTVKCNHEFKLTPSARITIEHPTTCQNTFCQKISVGKLNVESCIVLN